MLGWLKSHLGVIKVLTGFLFRLFLFVCFVWVSVFLDSPGSSGTHSVDQAGFILRESHLPLSPEWGSKGVHHHTWLRFSPSSFMLSMLKLAGAAPYGASLDPVLGSPRCLCVLLSYLRLHGLPLCCLSGGFFGLPLHLLPCSPPSSAIFGYLPSFIFITWLKYLKRHCCIL